MQTGNNVSLDFAEDHGPVSPQHYAFLVSESDFDQIFGRIRDQGLPHWADPGKRRQGEVNTSDGGRGVYWEDPSGHFLEIITRPAADPQGNAQGLLGRSSHHPAPGRPRANGPPSVRMPRD